MFSLVSNLLWPFAQPGNLLLLLLLLALLGLWRGPRRLALALLAAAVLTLTAVGLLPVGQWLMVPLENRFAEPALPPRVDGIVALGGSLSLSVSAARDTVALEGSVERLTKLIELARRYPEARLVLTGNGKPVTEAAVSLRFLREQGLPVDRVLLDERARNTYENATFSQALAQPAAGERWLLVTSAVHMPRAVGCFEAVGWPVTPFPVDYQTSGRFELADRFDVAQRLLELDAAVKEWLGLIAYRLAGRSSALLPGS
jgi:uncharacterized SAM-binding protein YcdF (DUF218 family)